MENEFLDRQEQYYQARADGPITYNENADKFYAFNPEKSMGSQLEIQTPEQIKQQKPLPTTEVDLEVQKCKNIKSCDELDGTNCGYCFYDDTFYYGDDKGPYTDVCPGGWVKTKEECQKRRERAICEKVKSCGAMTGDASICAWCPTSQKAFVYKMVNGVAVPKYDDDKCDDPDLQGNQLGLVLQKDCAEFEKDHPCVGPNEKTGPHSIDCLKRLWMEAGGSVKGTFSPDKNQDLVNKWNTMSRDEAFADMKSRVKGANSGIWQLVEQNYQGVYGTSPNPCDKKYNPRPMECVEEVFKSVGCTDKGLMYPSEGNIESWKAGNTKYPKVLNSGFIQNLQSGFTLDKLKSFFTGVKNNMSASDYETKAQANEMCLGNIIASPPPLNVGDKVQMSITVPPNQYTDVCVDGQGTNTIVFEGYICRRQDNNKYSVIWEKVINPNPSERCKGRSELPINMESMGVWSRQKNANVPEWVLKYLGRCSVAPSYFSGVLDNFIDGSKLKVIQSCNPDFKSGCENNCALYTVLLISQSNRFSYSIKQNEVSGVLNKLQNLPQLQDTRIATVDDIQRLVDNGVAECSFGWVYNDKRQLVPVYPSIKGTTRGCGGGNVGVVLDHLAKTGNYSEWNQGNRNMYVITYTDPSVVEKEIEKIGGVYGRVVAVLGKELYDYTINVKTFGG